VSLVERLEEAAAAVRSRTPLRPAVGIVLGSGLGAFADALEDACAVPFAEIPHFPASTVVGHSGALVVGRSRGVPVAVMKGRVHFYEGYRLDEVVFPVRVLGRLGVKTLVLTNAAGAINPAFRNKVTAFQVNPFVKFGGLELFGVIERAEGRASAEAANREIRQYAIDTIYRIGPSDELFAAIRYNKVEGQLAGISGDVGANRWQMGAGMFLTPMIMAKLEYVKQEFTGYPVSHVRHGGKFSGLMLEGVVGF